MAYPNLKAELRKYGITNEQVMEASGAKSAGTVDTWLNGDVDMGVSKALRIYEKFFVGYDMNYLFSTVPLAPPGVAQ